MKVAKSFVLWVSFAFYVPLTLMMSGCLCQMTAGAACREEIEISETCDYLLCIPSTCPSDIIYVHSEMFPIGQQDVVGCLLLELCMHAWAGEATREVLQGRQNSRKWTFFFFFFGLTCQQDSAVEELHLGGKRWICAGTWEVGSLTTVPEARPCSMAAPVLQLQSQPVHKGLKGHMAPGHAHVLCERSENERSRLWGSL